MIFSESDRPECQRLKWAFESCKNGAWGDEPDGETDAVCIRAADFSADLGRLNNGERTLRSIDDATYRKVGLQAGDLVVEKSGGGEKQLVGRSVIYGGAERAVCSNFLARCRPSDLVTSEYLNYLMLAIYKGRGTYPHIKQTTGIQNLDMASFLNTRVKFPIFETQKRIAAFLDNNTGQIDGLIEKKRALLDRLAEQRQSIITQAVTKGLDPAASMKGSGIDWLGHIPAHWEVTSFRRSIWRIEQGWSPQCEERQKADDEWGILRSGCVNEGLFRPSDHKVLPSNIDPRPELEVRVGDLLMCRASGSLHLIGSAAVVDGCPSKLMISDKTYRIMLQLDVAIPEFVALALRSKYMREQIVLSVSGAGGLANNIPQSLVRSYAFVRPPLDEQRKIVARTGEQLVSLTQTEAQIASSIEKLVEYRSALVTSAVTGQIEGLR